MAGLVPRIGVPMIRIRHPFILGTPAGETPGSKILGMVRRPQLMQIKNQRLTALGKVSVNGSLTLELLLK